MTKLLLPLLLILCVPLMGDEKKDKEEFERTKAKAENYLGYMYAEGEGVLKDDKEAVKWYRKAAEQRNASAQNSLGLRYHKGEGVPKSIVNSYMWYNIAAANGQERAKINKPLITKQMTSEQIAKAQELSKEMNKKNPKLLQKKK